MPPTYVKFPQIVRDFLPLIRRGHLFALQEWIASGKPFRFPGFGHGKAQPLQLAVKHGFHSILEVLLIGGGWTHGELADALDDAIHANREDMVTLLLKHGARLTDIDFDVVCKTMDVGLMEQFVRDGGDPCRGNSFAWALAQYKAKPLIRFYKEQRREVPSLDDQAALALSEAVRKNLIGLAALLVWAGADPLRYVPWGMDEEFPVRPDCCITPAGALVWAEEPEAMFKVLRLNLTPAEAVHLLNETAYRPKPALFGLLIKELSPQLLNDSSRGSSEAFEEIVARRPSDDGENPSHWDLTANAHSLECLRLLISAGARWNPDHQAIVETRRWLLRHSRKHLSDVINLLLSSPDAVAPAALLDLLQSPSLASNVAATDGPLFERMCRFKAAQKAGKR